MPIGSVSQPGVAAEADESEGACAGAVLGVLDHMALGGRGHHIHPSVLQQGAETGGECHLAHQMHGYAEAVLARGAYHVGISPGQRRHGVGVGPGVYHGEGNVRDLAIFEGGGKLALAPPRHGMVAEVDESSYYDIELGKGQLGVMPDLLDIVVYRQ